MVGVRYSLFDLPSGEAQPGHNGGVTGHVGHLVAGAFAT